MLNANNDILSLIGLKLALDDLQNYSLINRKIFSICNTNIFWHNKIQTDYPNIDISNVKEYKKLYYYLSVRVKKESNFDIIYGYVVFRFFPSYTPCYYSPYTNIFKLEYKKIQEIYENLGENKTSFVIGNFKEIYKVIFYIHHGEDFNTTINLKRNIASGLRARFINNIIVINFSDTFENLF